MIRRLALLGIALCTVTVLAENQPPTIKHTPVKTALQSQGIVVRATVQDDANAIRSVTLYYALTKDMAPYKIDMQDSGAGQFTGTISHELLAGLTRAYYYVEAKDQVGSISETPWYTVEIRDGKSEPTPIANPTEPPVKKEESSWVKPTLIGVGVVAAGALAVGLANGGGGDDDGTPAPDPDPGVQTNEFVGVYVGTVTTCFSPPGEGSSCALSDMTITVDEDGEVTSNTIHPGSSLTGNLSGNDFLFVVPVSENNMTGQIEYLGTIVNDRISGSIQGSASSTNGTGTYSGNFSALRQ